MMTPVLALLVALRSLPPPSVYWVTSPTLANETLVVAGSFPASATTTRLCKTRDCAAGSQIPTPPTTSSWTNSIKLVLPAGCGPPCFLQITGGGSDHAVVAVNAPDVWWALSGAPTRGAAEESTRMKLSNQPLSATATVGDTIRVFGRSLGWSADSTSCLSAAEAPKPVPTTQVSDRRCHRVG